MKTATVVVVGIATAGLGLLWWRNRKAAEEAAAEGKKPVDPCELLPPPYNTYCGGVVGVLGGLKDVLEATGVVHDKSSEHAAEIARRDGVNKELNGAVKVPMAAMGTGTVQEFENGCQPFYDAPGWKNCAPGTQDMYASAVDNAFGYFAEYNTSDDDLGHDLAFPTMAAKIAQINADRESGYGDDIMGRNYKYGTRQIDKTLFGTGAVAISKHSDPLTSGPYWKNATAKDGDTYHGYAPDYVARADADEKFWYVKGRVVTCPAGQAPAMWTADGQPVRDHRGGGDYIPPCAPGGVVEGFGENADVAPIGPAFGGEQGANAAAGLGSGTHTALNCGPGGVAPAGYTWVRATATVRAHWERVRAGETPNNGPCDPNYRDPGELVAGIELTDQATRAPAVLVASNPLPSRMVTKR